MHVPEPSMARGLVYAMAFPFVALALQWLAWPLMAPFVWFMFAPAVFFAVRLGGFHAGMFSALISAALAWYFFMEPRLSWAMAGTKNPYSVVLFLGLGYLFGRGELRVRHARDTAVAAQAGEAAAKRATEQIQKKATELEQAQQALLRYQHVVAHTSDMLSLLDRDLRYLMVNPAYAGELGLKPDDMHGRTVREVVGPAVFAMIQPQLEKALAGEPQRFVAEPALPDGRRRVLDAQYVPFVQQGSVQGVVVTLRDITELRDAATALQHSEQRLRLALQTSVAAQRDLRQQAEELAHRNAELERFNRATVGREVDMVALKQQVNAMARELGRPAPYPLVFLADPGAPQKAPE